MEAMALEKPVVAADVEGTQELVDDGRTSLLVPLGDIDAMQPEVMSKAFLRCCITAAGITHTLRRGLIRSLR
ncbi:MAG: glycosyltransferase [Planctomycetota bacterium]|jgi:hypothetical protein